MEGKKTKGKQKIEMKKIVRVGDRMTTFSKRKSGIYKKANELVAMCDVDIAFLVFSGSDHAYTFAHPSMEAVNDRLRNCDGPQHQPPTDNATVVMKAMRRQRADELAEEYERVAEGLKEEKEKEKMMEKMVEEKKMSNAWSTASMEDLDDDGRRRMHHMFLELHNRLCDFATAKLRSMNGEGSSSGFGR